MAIKDHLTSRSTVCSTGLRQRIWEAKAYCLRRPYHHTQSAFKLSTHIITETVEYESEEHILPSNSIPRSDDVEVINDSNKVAPRVLEEYMDRVTRFEMSSR